MIQYLYNKYGAPISYDLWRDLQRLVDFVCAHWREPDAGIWEVRNEPRHFVYSKLMCWVALDRGLRLANKRSFPADQARWLENRDAIYVEIMERGWHQTLDAFVQDYDSDELDASSLLMPLVFFVSPTDPRMLRTLDRIRERLALDGLVGVGVHADRDGLHAVVGRGELLTQLLGGAGFREELGLEVDSRRKAQVGMARASVAKTAAMFTSPIRIDRAIEADVGRVVARDDGFHALDGHVADCAGEPLVQPGLQLCRGEGELVGAEYAPN